MSRGKLLFALFVFTVLLISSCQGNPVVPPASATDIPIAIGTPFTCSPNSVCVEGTRPFVPEAKGVSMAAGNIFALSTYHGFPPHDGYVYLLVEVTIVNHSNLGVLWPLVVDKFDNRFAPWGMASNFGLPALQAITMPNEASTGFAVYNVPQSVLDADLRLRWESEGLGARIELFFDESIVVLLEEPLPTEGQ